MLTLLCHFWPSKGHRCMQAIIHATNLPHSYLPSHTCLPPNSTLACRYSYMIGVANDLAMRHVPEVKPRNDTLAGPFGRRGDQVSISSEWD